MLLTLRIRNFAIIDKVDLDFPTGFTVVTGETGAGKSILVNALGLILGGRANTNIVRGGAESAEVEALFDISNQPLIRARLDQRELVGDDHEALLIRRVVSAKGRGKVSINGRLSTVATLGHIVAGLVDISGQHDQQSLLVIDNHLDILDAFAAACNTNFDALIQDYREAFNTLHSLTLERSQLQSSGQQNLQRADYLRFQIDEIERLQPLPAEDVQLEETIRRLGHAERLRNGAQLAESVLYGEDGSAFDKLGKATSELEALARIDSDLQVTCASLVGARREIEEAARSLQRYAENIEADPTTLDHSENRLADLQQLCRKHGMPLDDVIARTEALTAELDTIDNAETRMAELATAIDDATTKATQLATALSETRMKAARRLSEAVGSELAQMDLDGARFTVHLTQLQSGNKLPGPQGFDKAEFLWSANQGEPERPLARIASGGELSRLMLAVKTVLSNHDLVSLYVFDEVDAGLGGRAADCIARKIQQVAKGHQAITITHLAPIAARADNHLCVSKSVVGHRTLSNIVALTGKERADEIARMIDGAQITDATRTAAQQMLTRR